MTKSVEEQMADIERRMKQLRARKQRIVARENAKARKRRTHLIIRLGGILSNEGVLGYDEGVWNDEGNRQRLLDMLKAHAAELRAWASDAGVRLPSAESAGELREQVRDLPQEPQIQEQPLWLPARIPTATAMAAALELSRFLLFIGAEPLFIESFVLF